MDDVEILKNLSRYAVLNRLSISGFRLYKTTLMLRFFAELENRIRTPMPDESIKLTWVKSTKIAFLVSLIRGVVFSLNS